MGKFRKYPEYFSSGVEWLEEIPSRWKVKKLKFVSSIQPSNVDKKSKDDEVSIELCNYTDVYYNERIDSSLSFMKATATDEQIKKFTLCAGDTIITKDSEDPSDIAVPAYVPEDLPGIVCGYHLAIIRPKDRGIGPYIKRVFETGYARSYFSTRANGLTRYGLGTYPLRNIYIAIPPRDEAQNIAAFLDHETAKIDRLIARQERLIELLKEKRQAVISHAVTKGLNPDAPMKDSGVEWLGEVPAHWSVGRIKNLALLISKGTTPTTVGGEFLSEGIRFLKAENISEGLVTEQPEFFINKETHIILSRSSLHDKDVLVVIAGATTGKAAVMPNALLPANTNQAVSFIRLKDKRYAKFVARWMGTNFVLNHVWLNAVQAAQPNLSMEDLGNLPIVIPPAEELAALLEGLSSKLGAFDKLLEKTNTSIQLMQEHRTALISAAVTGKIDVRGWQQPNTEPQETATAVSA